MRAFGDAGIATDTPCTIHLSGVSAGKALTFLLKPMSLTYWIEDELIIISTLEAAELRLATRVYDVADLHGTRDEDSIPRLLMETIQPASWSVRGGNGSCIVYCSEGIEVLVVYQTSQIHEEIQTLLRNIRSCRKTPTHVQGLQRSTLTPSPKTDTPPTMVPGMPPETLRAPGAAPGAGGGQF